MFSCVWQRLAAHHDVASSSWHASAPHWWGNHPAASTGDLLKYTQLYADRLAVGQATQRSAAPRAAARVVTVDASPNTFGTHMCGQWY